MNLNRYIQITIGIILLAGMILSSSAGGAENGNGALNVGNSDEEGTSLIALAGSLLDTSTGSLNTENSLPIASTGPAASGLIYEDPSSEAGPPEYTIIGSAGGGGTITPSGQVSIPSGGSATFSIIPDTGYEIRSVLIDGEDIGGVTGYTFENVCADHQVEARFRSVSGKESAGTLEGGTTGVQGSDQSVGDPLVTALPGSISKTAVVTVASDPTYYTEGEYNWQARKAHTIHNPKSTAQTDYMVRFTIHRTTGTDSGEDCYLGNLVQSDYRDLRFTTTANVAYDYMIEESDEDQATVWVTIPSLAVDEGIQMYIYYGCPDAPSGASEGSLSQAIFEEDFETSTAAWTVESGCTLTRVAEGDGYVGRLVTVGSDKGANKAITDLADLSGDLTLEYNIKPAQTNQWISASAYAGASNYNGAYFYHAASANYYVAPTAPNYFGSYVANQWRTIKMVFKPGRTYDLYINNVLTRQNVGFYGSTTANLNVISLRGYGSVSKTAYFDNIKVYRGSSASPTPDAGVHFDWTAAEYDPDPVTAAFSFSPDPGIVYFPVFFTDESTGLITDWDWSFGDGSTASGTGSASHTYLTEGSKTVTLTVTNMTGSTFSETKTINVVASSGVTWNGTISVTTGSETTTLVPRIHSAATEGYNSVLDEYTGFPFMDKTNAALDSLYLKRAKPPIAYGDTETWVLTIDVPAGKTATVSWTKEPLLEMEIKEGTTVKTSGFTAAAGAHTYTVSVKWMPYSLQLRQGWTMVSLPVVPSDDRTSVIFKDVTSGVTNPVRTWENNAFVAVTNMQPKKGYWVHSNSAITVSISGTAITGEYSLQKGWNMIGTPGVTILDISIIPNQVVERPAQTWNGLTFETVTQLRPGTAAWIFVTEGS